MIKIYTAKHILVDSLEEAEQIKLSLNKGAVFEELAKTYSKCPSKDNGGDLGKFGTGMMVKPFEDAVDALEINAISDPVQSPFGYHIIVRTG